MLDVNVDHYHITNRTATTNGPISLACAAGLGKYGYGNGFTVMERISGTVLVSQPIINQKSPRANFVYNKACRACRV